jgi:erythritol transport system ATP-binding protein
LPGCGQSRREQSQFRGQKVRTGGVRDALKAGMVLMPEDRQRDGLFPELSIRENVVMAAKTGLFLTRDEETRRAQACG